MKLIDASYFPAFKKNYKMWPISFQWGCYTTDGKRFPGTGAHAFICAHGWQVGWNNGSRVYGWTIHIGMFKIFFGPRNKK